jgi:hypothetical protein
MRRTLAALVAGAALVLVAPSAQASHPCWDFNELTCWATRPCISERICT